MSHVRAQITAAVAAALTGLTTTGSRVHVARPADNALPQSGLPALLIYADAESVDTSPTVFAWPFRQERMLEVRVEALAADDGTIEATLATMLAEIEAGLNASQATNTLGGLVPAGLRLTGVETVREAEADVIIGRLITTWTGTYYTYSNAPETAAT
jgi:hypothetical protein